MKTTPVLLMAFALFLTGCGRAGTETAAPEPKGTETPQGVSEENKKLSRLHYESGVIYWKEGKFSLARDEWTLAKFLDPANEDAVEGVKRANALFNDDSSGP